MRLTRTGAKKRPTYRVIVADSRAPREGRHVDILGYYDPLTQPATINIDTERAVKWLRNGAQPSERVRILLRHSGVLKAHEEARLADKRARKDAAGDAEGGVTSRVVAVAGRAASVVGTAAGTVANAAGTVADTAESVVETVTDVAGSAVEAVTGAAGAAAEVVSDAVEAVTSVLPGRRGRSSGDKAK
jgi:small subunit ribosomal protein S16